MSKLKKSSGAVQVSRTMQQVFIGSVVLLWAMSVATTLFLFIRASGYVGAGTWAFQATQMLLPLAFVGLSYSYARRTYREGLGRIFFTMLLGVTAYLVFAAIALFENTLRLHYSWFMPKDFDASIWNAFAHDWVVMLIGLALFTAVLGWKEKKHR